MSKKYITGKQAQEALSIIGVTLRKWANEGRIDYIRTDGGHRRYNIESLQKELDVRSIRYILYARVSSGKQVKEPDTQSAYLQSRYPDGELIREIGSGLNFKRKGLKTILDRCLSGDKLCVVVAYKDRLARFGFELIKHVVEYNGGSVVVPDDDTASPEHELVKDFITITTLFSARIHGLRKYTDEIKKDQADID